MINNTGRNDASATGVSAANYGVGIAPGSIATIFGKTLTDATTPAPTLPSPTVLANTKVKVLDQNGVERLAKTLPGGMVDITCQFYPATDGIGGNPSASFTISIK